MKKRIGSTIIILILLIVGLGILLYPTFSDQWNKRRAASLVTEYEQQISEKDDSEIEEIRMLAVSYNRTLIGNTLPDAFAELQLPPDATYDSMLNPVGSGYMGTVEIPKINVDLPIYHYTTTEVLEKGAGHLAGSSLPVGGDSTHSVISAHRGLPSAKLFTDLDRMEEGDIFFIHVLEETLAYEVELIKVIEPSDTSDLNIQPGKDLCTLFTCTPYAVNTHRLLVRGHRIPYTEEVQAEAEKQAAGPTGISILTLIICVVIGLALAAIIIFFISKRKKRKDEKSAEDKKGIEESPAAEGEEPLEDKSDAEGEKDLEENPAEEETTAEDELQKEGGSDE